MIEVVAILVTAADREDPSTEDSGERMDHAALIAVVRKQVGKAVDDPDTLLGQGEQSHTAVR